MTVVENKTKYKKMTEKERKKKLYQQKWQIKLTIWMRLGAESVFYLSVAQSKSKIKAQFSMASLR